MIDSWDQSRQDWFGPEPPEIAQHRQEHMDAGCCASGIPEIGIPRCPNGKACIIRTWLADPTYSGEPQRDSDREDGGAEDVGLSDSEGTSDMDTPGTAEQQTAFTPNAQEDILPVISGEHVGESHASTAKAWTPDSAYEAVTSAEAKACQRLLTKGDVYSQLLSAPLRICAVCNTWKRALQLAKITSKDDRLLKNS